VATRDILETIPFAPPGAMPYKVLPCGIRFTPDGKTAVIALGRADAIALVDTQTRKVRSYVKTGGRPWHLAITADGTRAVVANGTSNDVAVVDLASGKVTARIPTGEGPWGVALAE